MTTTTSFEEIELELLHESKHNPRRHVDDAALKELAASIAKVGVLTPLLVRPNAKGFEIAAGHRRYRAAKLAERKTVPCLVRQLADPEFMEILTIENLQREDLHPLDEAKGYEALMAPPYRMDVETIATKVGRSVKYIYDRRKLLELTKEAQTLFWDGMIEAGHAILLARLTPAEQAKVIGTKSRQYADGGLLQPCRGLYDEDGGYDDQHLKACSVRELEDYIKRHIRFNAKKADAFLYPETVAQVAAATEEKRKIIEITHEYLADNDVRQAGEGRVYGERAWKRADGHEGSKACERSVLGVIASGPGQGQAFKVCVNKETCTVHYGAEIKAREKRRKDAEKGTTATGKKKPDKWELGRQKDEAERKRDDARRAQWRESQPAILEAVAARVKVMPANATGLLAELVMQALDSSWDKSAPKAKKYVPRGTKAEDLVRCAAFLVLYDAIDDEWSGPKRFPATAKALGVDLKKLLKPMPASAPEKGK